MTQAVSKVLRDADAAEFAARAASARGEQHNSSRDRKPRDPWGVFVLWNDGLLTTPQYEAAKSLSKLIERGMGQGRNEGGQKVDRGLNDPWEAVRLADRYKREAEAAQHAVLRQVRVKRERTSFIRAFDFPHRPVRLIEDTSKAQVALNLRSPLELLALYFEGCDGDKVSWNRDRDCGPLDTIRTLSEVLSYDVFARPG